jgi:uncharacterized protein (TIGR01244 family)
MRSVQVDEKLSVSAQPALKDFESMVQQGAVMLINNRPDGEDADQPGNELEARAAGAVGIQYRYIPVVSKRLTEADIRRFQAALAESPGPVLAHCKSGTRSLMLWVLGEVLDGRIEPREIEPFGRFLGFDLGGAVAWWDHTKDFSGQ